MDTPRKGNFAKVKKGKFCAKKPFLGHSPHHSSQPHGMNEDEFAAEVFVTSSASLRRDSAISDALAVMVERASGHKCARCWRVLPQVKAPSFLCERCDDAVAHWDAAKAGAAA